MTFAFFTREFTFNGEDTCNRRWIFTLSESADGLVVSDLEITGEPEPEGCVGHSKTITALVRGRPINSIGVGALAEATCVRSLSCGQVLARCLREIAET